MGYGGRAKKYAELRGNTQKHGTKSPCDNRTNVGSMAKAVDDSAVVATRMALMADDSIMNAIEKVVDNPINRFMTPILGSRAAPLQSVWQAESA